MNKQQLIEQIKLKKSFLCVGLDTDIKKIPEHLLNDEDPIFAFNKAIIDATAPYCIAYKPNLAFYESMGVKGWISFEKTVEYIKKNVENPTFFVFLLRQVQCLPSYQALFHQNTYFYLCKILVLNIFHKRV